MAESESEAHYKQEFIARVKAAREALGWKQWEMAEALGMVQDKYKQYESRSYLPHPLIPRFCRVTHRSFEWLMSGKGEKYPKPLEAVASEPAAKAKPKKARSREAA